MWPPFVLFSNTTNVKSRPVWELSVHIYQRQQLTFMNLDATSSGSRAPDWGTALRVSKEEFLERLVMPALGTPNTSSTCHTSSFHVGENGSQEQLKCFPTLVRGRVAPGFRCSDSRSVLVILEVGHPHPQKTYEERSSQVAHRAPGLVCRKRI